MKFSEGSQKSDKRFPTEIGTKSNDTIRTKDQSSERESGKKRNHDREKKEYNNREYITRNQQSE